MGKLLDRLEELKKAQYEVRAAYLEAGAMIAGNRSARKSIKAVEMAMANVTSIQAKFFNELMEAGLEDWLKSIEPEEQNDDSHEVSNQSVLFNSD